MAHSVVGCSAVSKRRLRQNHVNSILIRTFFGRSRSVVMTFYCCVIQSDMYSLALQLLSGNDIRFLFQQAQMLVFKICPNRAKQGYSVVRVQKVRIACRIERNTRCGTRACKCTLSNRRNHKCVTSVSPLAVRGITSGKGFLYG